MTPDQEARIAALVAELEEQIARAGVDMPAASLELDEIDPPTVRQISETEHIESHSVDLLGILDTLRSLPDNAGTAAFVAAYGARLLDSRESPYADE